ncbi:MAG: LacI family DNA-binding transcriptional regulator, partial [Clostridia bacterium]|nr:LacI family DNA-binding transcriptional regulator [Clostridia bacterium]
EKIEAAVAELGYKVNTTARALKTSRSMTIGIIMEDLTNSFYSGVMSVVDNYFLESGYSSIITETKGRSEESLRKLDLLLSKRVDGIICFTSCCDLDFINTCIGSGVGLVVVDSLPQGGQPCGSCDFILTDNVCGAFDATRHLVENGHHEIAVITGDSSRFSAGERLRGYQECLVQSGIPVRGDLIFTDEYNIDGGYRCPQLLARLTSRPTAVLVCNYLMALGALVAFNENDLRAGEELSLIMFDEIQANSAFRPRLTTVGQSLDEIGRLAAERILLRARGGDLPDGIFRIPARLIIRDSVVRLK